jgi:hypothetical protein
MFLASEVRRGASGVCEECFGLALRVMEKEIKFTKFMVKR